MKNTETASQWLLIDMINPDQFGLLSIGDKNFSGASVRKNLSALARELLLERTRRVIAAAAPVSETVDVRGDLYDVRIEPIVSPTNRTVLAALAIYAPAGTVLPPRPLIGAIEWMIVDGGRHISTAWDDNMFTLYGIKRSGMGSAGDFSQWVNELIAPEDRARMKVVITGGIAAPDDQRHLVAYRILTGDGESKHLEASGRVYTTEDSSVKWLRSITREVPVTGPAVVPNNVDTSSGPLLRAALELAQDVAVIAVDVTWSQIFMRSPSWETMGLQIPANGHLPHVVHPDDMQVFLELTAELGGEPGGPACIRLLHTDGSYQRYSARASNGHAEPGGDHRYVVVSLRPEKKQG